MRTLCLCSVRNNRGKQQILFFSHAMPVIRRPVRLIMVVEDHLLCFPQNERHSVSGIHNSESFVLYLVHRPFLVRNRLLLHRYCSFAKQYVKETNYYLPTFISPGVKLP